MDKKVNSIKIAVISGSRADYGYLRALISLLDKDKEINLSLIITGMHLSPEFGKTEYEIIEDGFEVYDKIEMLVSSDTKVAMIKSIGIGMIGFSDCFDRLSPDLVICLGDRFEIFAAVYSASLLNIPIAHIHGGELTYGAVDDQLRHAITKASSLHFPVTEIYKNRIIQMGENPKTVINVGALAVERIAKVKKLSMDELENRINIPLKEGYLLVTIHPPTQGNIDINFFINEIFTALEKFDSMSIVMSYANTDPGGKIINKLKTEFCMKNPNKRIIKASLGQDLYISLLRNASVVVGNSSSGIIEAPITKTPVVNIGNRQDGRIIPSNAICVNAEKDKIYSAIKKMINLDVNKIDNHPFGNGDTSKKILKEIKVFSKNFKNTPKKFYDLV